MDKLMLGAFGPFALATPYLLQFLVIGPLLIYPLARWRANREPVGDQQLGIKVALGYFGMLAFQLALIGATTILFAMLSKGPSEDRGEIYRIGFGFLIPGLIILGTHVALLKRTNQDQFPSVRRLCLGYNLVLTGLVGLTAFVLACQALFSKGSSGDFGRFSAAAFVIYGAAWCASGIQLGRMVLGTYTPALARDVVLPAPTSHQPSGPTLPPLGGGAFPPIDPKS